MEILTLATTRARAKSEILKWYDSGASDAQQRRGLARDIDRFFDTNAVRSNWCECISSGLFHDEALEFSMRGSNWRARPTKRGIAVTSIVPGWAIGWRSILTDEFSYDTLSWLGHFARQYIHRSNIAKVLMAAWERQGAILHPFKSDMTSQRYSDLRPRGSDKNIFLAADNAIEAEWQATTSPTPAYRSKWASRNTLDPAIHQAIFHFLRAQSLLASEFEMEAVVAFDCVLQSLQQLDWKWAPGNPVNSRRDLCLALGLGTRAADHADYIYFLRNEFAAHAGGWRWWDAGDYVDHEMLVLSSTLASRALRKAADIEPLHRTIEPEPADWAAWLETHFPQLWRAIWFKDPN